MLRLALRVIPVPCPKAVLWSWYLDQHISPPPFVWMSCAAVMLRDAFCTRLAGMDDTVCFLVQSGMINAVPAVTMRRLAWLRTHRLAVLTWLLSWMLAALAQEVRHSEDVAVSCRDEDAGSPGAGA